CCTALGALTPVETPWPRRGGRAPASLDAAGGVHDPENAAVAQAIVNESAASPALNHPPLLQDRQVRRHANSCVEFHASPRPASRPSSARPVSGSLLVLSPIGPRTDVKTDS